MKDAVGFIGDVHGVLAPVKEAIERAENTAETIVFLGDYVNRGSQSREVLDFLVDVALDLGGRIHFLAGHHDLALLDAIDEGHVDRFLRMGGAATLSGYPGPDGSGSSRPLLERIPIAHTAFLRGLESCYTEEGVFAMHDQAEAPELTPGQFGVFGHRVLPDGLPKITDRAAFIDTGCGTLPNGHLTCFQWPSRRWFQTA